MKTSGEKARTTPATQTRKIKITQATTKQPKSSTSQDLTTMEMTTRPNQCEELLLKSNVCNNLPYKYTSIEKSSTYFIKSTIQTVQTFEPLFRVGCSDQLQNFICSYYFPKCESNKVLPPCRELCEESRNGCNPLMEKFSFQWPENLKCDRFPKRNINGDNCFSGNITTKT